MDSPEEAQLRAAVEHQGAILNRQAEELSHACHTMDALVAQVTEQVMLSPACRSQCYASSTSTGHWS